MQVNLEFLFTLAILAAFAIAIFMARNWPIQTSLFPLITGGIGFSMALVQLIIHLRNRKKVLSEDRPASEYGARAKLIASGWVLGFFTSTIVFGFQWGLPGAVFLYLQIEGKEKLALSIPLTALSWIIIYGMDNFMHLPLYGGLL